MKNTTIISTAKILDAMIKLEKTGIKCLVVVDKNNILLGTITDGDIRRSLIKGLKLNTSISKLYNKKPSYFIQDQYTEADLKNLIIKQTFDLVPIVDKNKKYIKHITWKDLLKNDNKNKYKKIKRIPVVIIAGGKGKRLGVLSKILPKPLLPINDKTLLQNIMDYFINYGLSSFYITINYKADLITSFFSYLKSYKIKFIKENTFLGTAGSLSLLKNLSSKNVIVTNCDGIFSFNLYEAIENHNSSSNDITMIVTEEITKIPYGVCKFDKNYHLNNISEKPEYNHIINTGMYIMKTNILKNIKNNEKIDMNFFLKRLIKKKCKIGMYKINQSHWLDYGDIKQLDKI